MTVVRKKSLDTTGDGGKIPLSSHLQQVREAIKQLPGENMEQEGTTAGATPETPQPAASTSKRKSTVKKKVAAKKTPAAKPNGSAEAGFTLAAIAKSLKIEPRRARRILRTADGVPDAGARWTWTKASDVAKVKSILTKATKDE